MTTLLRFFYRLPLEYIAQCFLLLSLVYVCVQQHHSCCRWFRLSVRAALVVWIVAVLWITTFSRSPGSGSAPELVPLHSYRKLLSGGNPEIIRTNFMNAVLFYPAGILAASLLPERWPRRYRLLALGVSFALFSLAIEYTQFRYLLGKPETDDVIHNTLGAVCGAVPVLLKDFLYAPPE